jgi:hypothetical protein
MTTAAVEVPARATAAERAALARAVLARAERRTGTAAWVRRPPVAAPDEPRAAPLDPGSAASVLPVHPALADLLPRGGLERGSALVVGGSTSLVLALLAEASQAGGWAALVGMPRVGVLAAHQLGLELGRLVLVPAPGPDAPTVVAALVDGVDVVVVGDVALNDADRRRLSARARERGAVLVSTVPWPGAHVTLTAELARWEGLGRGEGRLRRRVLTVRGGGRGAAARGWSAQVVVPPPAPEDARQATAREATGGATGGGAVVRGPWEGRRAG